MSSKPCQYSVYNSGVFIIREPLVYFWQVLGNTPTIQKSTWFVFNTIDYTPNNLFKFLKNATFSIGNVDNYTPNNTFNI